MQSYLDHVLLRLDTYLLYDDYKKHTQELKNLSNGTPSEIFFDEGNMQLIDIDSVADLHNTYINKILETNMICLKNGQLSDIKCDIYVTPYFVTFYIPSNGKPIEKIIHTINETYIKEIKIPLLFGYLRLNYSICKQSKENIWTICDKSAFPIMEDEDYSGQYTDSTERDDVYIDLSRTISSSDKESRLVDINIQTKAIFSISNITEQIPKVIELSKREISRCFNA